MVIRYHTETDMLYIQLISGVAVDSEEVAPHIVLDFDDQNRVLGIEIEDASQVVELQNWGNSAPFLQS